MGTLYIVATPIGNLQDITLRAIGVLKKVDTIACEDTRKTSILLKSLEIEGKFLLSYYEQVEARRIPEIINALKNDLSIALVSDAGTPTVSDPGFKLVRECKKEGIKIEAVPGPSSVIASLVVSGLPTDKFMFVGYPPKKIGHRKTFFLNIKKSNEALKTTVILFEAPHKICKTLSEMKEIFGDIEVTVARELTKVYEEVKSGTISELISYFKNPKGEFIVLFSPIDS